MINSIAKIIKKSEDAGMRIFLIVVQSIIGEVLGRWDGLLSALVLFMVVEYLTQILVMILNKKISSEIGFCGIAKKVSIIFLVIIGNVIDVLVIQNGNIIRTAFLAVHESERYIIFLCFYGGFYIREWVNLCSGVLLPNCI